MIRRNQLKKRLGGEKGVLAYDGMDSLGTCRGKFAIVYTLSLM